MPAKGLMIREPSGEAWLAGVSEPATSAEAEAAPPSALALPSSAARAAQLGGSACARAAVPSASGGWTAFAAPVLGEASSCECELEALAAKSPAAMSAACCDASTVGASAVAHGSSAEPPDARDVAEASAWIGACGGGERAPAPSE
eukprot:CAMPEP_0119429314 /NCGR_PEP_ID=MMETSP1335-20130426/41968_1 /TAXON_ID=259385 /ORGANISM="Chrysoculter rhomboideus, Strain RCC1486" /LENGTH=145 /DNA_ID=CAMNT_0007455029 /DNA_START=229 /DNA_END=663 /DNA_ORIENTATION=+